MKRIIVICLWLCATNLYAQLCPVCEELKALKEQKLLEKTLSVHTTDKNFIVEVTEVPLAGFGLLCDVYHKDFAKWKQSHPDAEMYAMCSFGYDKDNKVERVTLYIRALNPQIPQNPSAEWLQQLTKEEEKALTENTVELKNAQAIQLLQKFNTEGVDISEYNPAKYYCGTGEVDDPSERNWMERKFVPQVANFACFIHDRQYLVCGRDQNLSDRVLEKNAYYESLKNGYSKEEAVGFSSSYYTGVRFFAKDAYKKAQLEACRNIGGGRGGGGGRGR